MQVHECSLPVCKDGVNSLLPSLPLFSVLNAECSELSAGSSVLSAQGSVTSAQSPALNAQCPPLIPVLRAHLLRLPLLLHLHLLPPSASAAPPWHARALATLQVREEGGQPHSVVRATAKPAATATILGRRHCRRLAHDHRLLPRSSSGRATGGCECSRCGGVGWQGGHSGMAIVRLQQGAARRRVTGWADLKREAACVGGKRGRREGRRNRKGDQTSFERLFRPTRRHPDSCVTTWQLFAGGAWHETGGNARRTGACSQRKVSSLVCKVHDGLEVYRLAACLACSEASFAGGKGGFLAAVRRRACHPGSHLA